MHYRVVMACVMYFRVECSSAGTRHQWSHTSQLLQRIFGRFQTLRARIPQGSAMYLGVETPMWIKKASVFLPLRLVDSLRVRARVRHDQQTGLGIVLRDVVRQRAGRPAAGVGDGARVPAHHR